MNTSWEGDDQVMLRHPCIPASVIEQLERRRLLSGAVVTSEGTLVVTGNETADLISAGFNDDGDYVITFNDGTPSATFQLTEFNDVVFNLLGGFDTLQLDHGVPGGRIDVNPTVNGGDGNDNIELTTADAHVVGGAGNEIVYLIQGGGVLSYDGGAGRDMLYDTGENKTVDLRPYPMVENGAVFSGTVIGNSLNNLLTTTQSATLLGGGGNDFLVGGGADDSLDGGAGNDTLDGNAGADVMKGGTGVDTVSYTSRAANLSVTLGTTPNDGEAGEGDNAWFDVENIEGGYGHDYLSGTGSANRLNGRAGNDTIQGFGGNDTLSGGSGNDRLFGSTGNDQLDGNSGNDTLDGGAGNDVLRGHEGDDWLFGRDGAFDVLDGSIGFDRAQRDAVDQVKNIDATIP
jgi:Ca2+-binding RTX toxin-like protein